MSGFLIIIAVVIFVIILIYLFNRNEKYDDAGKVYKGKIIKTGESVAIKRVFQDPKYKNREV